MNEIKRSFILKKIEVYWRVNRPVFLEAPAKCGKTRLLKSIPLTLYIDCRQPTEQMQHIINNASLDTSRFALDNAEFLHDVSLLRNLARSHCKVIVTGACSCYNNLCKLLHPDEFSRIRLNPLSLAELEGVDLHHRLKRGGVPCLYKSDKGRGAYTRWLSNFWANIAKANYRIDNKKAFLDLTSYIARNSGLQFDAKSLESTIGMSRVSIKRYLKVLGECGVIYTLKPFATSPNEIKGYPRVYFFDTGFVYHYNNLKKTTIRKEDNLKLWKTLVLNELVTIIQTTDIFYWKDKRGHEIDFILKSDDKLIGIQCAWNAQALELAIKNIKSFGKRYSDSTIFGVLPKLKEDGLKNNSEQYPSQHFIPTNLKYLSNYITRHY